MKVLLEFEVRELTEFLCNFKIHWYFHSENSSQICKTRCDSLKVN